MGGGGLIRTGPSVLQRVARDLRSGAEIATIQSLRMEGNPVLEMLKMRERAMLKNAVQREGYDMMATVTIVCLKTILTIIRMILRLGVTLSMLKTLMNAPNGVERPRGASSGPFRRPRKDAG